MSRLTDFKENIENKDSKENAENPRDSENPGNAGNPENAGNSESKECPPRVTAILLASSWSSPDDLYFRGLLTCWP